MLIHPFLSTRQGNFRVAEADALGFVVVKRFKTLKGAQNHALKVNGVVEGEACKCTTTKRSLRIIKK